jgi:hypothetical protein
MKSDVPADLHGRVKSILDQYSQGSDDDGYEDTEPEDVWRMFRDLRAALAVPAVQGDDECPSCGSKHPAIHNLDGMLRCQDAFHAAVPAVQGVVMNGVCLGCGGAVLESGEHIDPERHAAQGVTANREALVEFFTGGPWDAEEIADSFIAHFGLSVEDEQPKETGTEAADYFKRAAKWGLSKAEAEQEGER